MKKNWKQGRDDKKSLVKEEGEWTTKEAGSCYKIS
jgi:hypothetical protein